MNAVQLSKEVLDVDSARNTDRTVTADGGSHQVREYHTHPDHDTVKTSDSSAAPMLKVGDIAKRMNISIRAVHRLVASGQLPPPLKIGRSSRWLEEDVVAFTDKLRQPRRKYAMTPMKGGGI